MIVKRVALGVLTLILLTINFLSVEALPEIWPKKFWSTGYSGSCCSDQKDLGLDLPPHIRYVNWLGGMLQGDFGTSLALKRPLLT